MLAGLVGHSLGLAEGMPAPYREAATSMVREALASVERKLEGELAEAQASADEARAGAAEQEAAQKRAKAEQSELQKIIMDSKTGISEATKAVKTLQHGLKASMSGQKDTQDKLQAAAVQVEQLSKIEQDIYQPLKGAAAQGPEGQKQLKCIQKFGKEIGIQGTLLETIPHVLKKSLDKRRTFESFIMVEFEAEFAKQYACMEAVLKDNEARFNGCVESVQEAQARLADSERSLGARTEALSEARAALARSTAVLAAAGHGARKLAAAEQRAARALALARARLEAFRAGPLAAFGELRAAPPLGRPEAPRGQEAEAEGVHTIPPMAASRDVALDSPGVTLAWEPTQTLVQ